MNTDELKALSERFEKWNVDSQTGNQAEPLADITEDLSDALRELLAERERMIAALHLLMDGVDSQGSMIPITLSEWNDRVKHARELLKEIEGK